MFTISNNILSPKKSFSHEKGCKGGSKSNFNPYKFHWFCANKGVKTEILNRREFWGNGRRNSISIVIWLCLSTLSFSYPFLIAKHFHRICNFHRIVAHSWYIVDSCASENIHRLIRFFLNMANNLLKSKNAILFHLAREF